jgi:hypothetical protein
MEMTMKSKTKIVLVLTIMHFSIVGIFFIILFTIATKYEILFVLTVLFSHYYIFGLSFLISPIIIFFCILGIITEGEKRINIICMVLSIIYEVGIIIYYNTL